jgi:hypothetical protein
LSSRLGRAAGLFKDNNQDVAAIDTKTLEDLEKELTGLGDSAGFEMCRDMALAMRAGLRDEKSHEWTKRAIDMFLSSGKESRNPAATLELISKTCLKDRGTLEKLTPVAIEALADEKLPGMKAEWAMNVFVDKDSTEKLCRALESRDEGPSVVGGEVAARLQRREESLVAWIERIRGRIEGNTGDRKARWCVLMGQAEAMKVTPNDPLRKMKWLVEAGKCAESAGLKLMIEKERESVTPRG